MDRLYVHMVVGCVLLSANALSPLTYADSPAAAADHEAAASSSYQIAVPVVRVEPVVSTRVVREPYRVCSSPEPVRQDHYHDPSCPDDHFSSPPDGQRYEGYYRRPQRGGEVARSIVGGLIGGAIGHQFGGGNGKKILTVVGALTGSQIARRGDRVPRHGREIRVEERDNGYRCRLHERERTLETITGYDVTYRYNGQLLTKRMVERPGPTISVRVGIEPNTRRRAPLPSTDPSMTPARQAVVRAG